MADQFKHGAEGSSTFLSAGVALDEYLGGPLKKLFTKTKGRPKVVLGEWYDFLYDAKSQVYSAPVLSELPLRQHMERCSKTGFVPKGKCTATAPWAQLIYGLGIAPSDGVLSKRSLPSEPSDDIKLEIEGGAVCHVINLLSLQGGWSRTSAMGGKHHTSVGDFIWRTDPNDQTKVVRLLYRPASEREISSPHPFFPPARSFCETPENLLFRYTDLCLPLGTSDVSLVWPEPKTSIGERLKKRREFLKNLAFTSFDQRPVFISETWQRDAERVRRRAFGGENFNVLDVLVADAQQRYMNDETFKQKMQWYESMWSGTSDTPTDCIHFAQKVKEACMVFEQTTDDVVSPEHPIGFYRPGRRALCAVLESYKDQPLNSWKHDLYLYSSELDGIMSEDSTLKLNRVFVYLLPLDYASALWQPLTLQLEDDIWELPW